MKLETLWIVCDPCIRDGAVTSELGDVCFEFETHRLENYIRGGARGDWEGRSHTLYVDKDAAHADALLRLAKARKRAGRLAGVDLLEQEAAATIVKGLDAEGLETVANHGRTFALRSAARTEQKARADAAAKR